MGDSASTSSARTSRLEADSLGTVEVDSENLWGAQTQRALKHFDFGSDRFPEAFIKAFALVKKAAALSHKELGKLSEQQAGLIVQACDEILAGEHCDQFPLSAWQSGSGTQTHMNINEVIANRCNELAGSERGKKSPIHPNDHVNISQSTNDVFPMVMHVSACLAIQHDLVPALNLLRDKLKLKADEFDSIVKAGRTHMMDAVPLTFGQEFRAFQYQVESGLESIFRAEQEARQLAIGGTAVGTGLNTEPGWPELECKTISELSHLTFIPADNKFAQIAAHDALVQVHGALNSLAASVLKIANDLRLMASGPHCGLQEISIPANEPGSSIMPGKVNPTQIESVSMVCLRVMGNNLAVSVAGSQGQFQLNAYKPLIIMSLLESIRLLSSALTNLSLYCISGISVNREQVEEYLSGSSMLVTALNTEIGYDKAAKIANYAFEKKVSLRVAAAELDILSGEQFDELVDARKMVGK